MYSLPHPSSWLLSKPSKLQVKQQAKTAVRQYWLAKLRDQAVSLSSLRYVRTGFLGLTRCHPLFGTCGSSPREIEKATTQARLLSGRYRLEALTGHWVPWNKEGQCTLPGCWGTADSHKGTVESFLISCPSLEPTRQSFMEFRISFLQANKHLSQLVDNCLVSDPVQFWLDCSTMAQVIHAVQCYGDGLLLGLFKLTRNFCHVLHKGRVSLLPTT